MFFCDLIDNVFAMLYEFDFYLYDSYGLQLSQDHFTLIVGLIVTLISTVLTFIVFYFLFKIFFAFFRFMTGGLL